MKILKYVIIAFVALLVIFLLMGMMKPTVSYGHEITVDKPVEEAWAVMMDESKYADWLKGFESMELIEGEKNAIGSKHKVVVIPEEGAEPFTMIETLEAFEEYKFVEMDYDSDMMTFHQKYIYEESEDGKTTITSDASVSGKSFIMRCMFASMETLTGAFTAQDKENMEALKEVINGNTTDYFPKPEETMLDTMAMDTMQ